MPVVPNRGAPWVRDSPAASAPQTQQDVPWRKVNLRKTSEAKASPDIKGKEEGQSSSVTPEQNSNQSSANAGGQNQSRPFTSKIQVNLQQKPEGKPEATTRGQPSFIINNPPKKESSTSKTIPIKIKIETATAAELLSGQPNKSKVKHQNSTPNSVVPTPAAAPAVVEVLGPRKRGENNSNSNSKNNNNSKTASEPPPRERKQPRERENRTGPSPVTKMSVNENGIVPTPPMPPPPPPPPAGGLPPPPPPPPEFGKMKPILSPHQKDKIEKLRKLPRKRPDWGTMMKEIEVGRKLNHVQCNDRSKPIIPRMKSLGKFVFDSEAKPASKGEALHNRLLTEIQSGVRLKKVATNDRSKPCIQGLRKFRRQLTVEEQENVNVNVLENVPEEPVYEIEDIDQLRDDLQSAKQMMDMEIQAKIKLGKENRDLQCQIIAMEAEIERLKVVLEPSEKNGDAQVNLDRRDSHRSIRKSRSGLYKCPSGIRKSKSSFGAKSAAPKEDDEVINELEEEINSLKAEVQQANKVAEDWEAKYKEASQKLLFAQGTLEDSEQKRLVLEKKLEKVQRAKGVSTAKFEDKPTQTEEQILNTRRQMSISKMGNSFSSQTSPNPNNNPPSFQRQNSTLDYEYTGSEDESSEIEVDEATVLKKKQEREIKLWENKLKSIKEKQSTSKADRRHLKDEQKRLEQNLKEEKAKLKKLQKEVDKMAKLLNKTSANLNLDEDEMEEDEEPEESEESGAEESEESESEESEESESSEEESSSEEDDPEAEHESRLSIFLKRVKRRENVLNALRKGNYLLRANIDNLKESHEDVRIKYQNLELELGTIIDL